MPSHAFLLALIKSFYYSSLRNEDPQLPFLYYSIPYVLNYKTL